MLLQKPLRRLREGALRGNLRNGWAGLHKRGVELPNELSEVPVRTLPVSGPERLPNSLPTMEAINMKGATAFVSTGLAATPSEELAPTEVPAICEDFAFSFHVVTLPQGPPNQWISSFVLRFEYTRAAALGETMMVV